MSNPVTWPAVPPLVDGDNLDAETLMTPVRALAQRTEVLWSRIEEVVGSSPFSSVRYPGAGLEQSGSLSPSPGDIVRYNASTGLYEKAVAQCSLWDDYAMGTRAFAAGILLDREGSTGTVLSWGMADVLSFGWDADALVESGESFRDGVYFLSSTEPGKLTAVPSGVTIIVGSFTSRTVGGTRKCATIVMSPEVQNLATAHLHRAYKLVPRPAGLPYYATDAGEDPDPTSKAYVVGYKSEAEKLGTAAQDAYIPRLGLGGTWTSTGSVSYTVSLSAAPTADITPSKNDGWSSVYLRWTSDDPSEKLIPAAGRCVRVRAFDIPVEIGTHGLMVWLSSPASPSPEDMAEASPADKAKLAYPYDAGSQSVSESEAQQRQWAISLPDMASGWQSASAGATIIPVEDGADVEGDLYAIGSPAVAKLELLVHSPGATAAIDCATAVSGTVVSITVENIDYVFEFSSSTEVQAGHILVPWFADHEQTAESFCKSVNAQHIPGVIPRWDDEGQVVIGVPEGTLVDLDGSAVIVEPNYSDDDGLPSYIYVMDGRLHQESIIQPSAHMYYSTASGVVISIVPAYDDNGAYLHIPAGTLWRVELASAAPGARFRYAIGFDLQLSAAYPPVPYKAAALIANGVEQDSDAFWTPEDGATYGLRPDSLYWYPGTYGATPWSSAYVGPDEDVPDWQRLRLLLHFSKTDTGCAGPVTSLRAAPGSMVSVKECSTGKTGNVGDLELDVSMDFGTEKSDVPGYNVPKRIAGSHVYTGPVVERIVAGPGVAVTQYAGCPAGQGTVVVSTGSGYSGEFDEIALENAKQDRIGYFPFIKLLGWNSTGQNIPSAFTAKFQVPLTAMPGYYRVKVYMTVFGLSGFTGTAPLSAGLAFSYNILPDWTTIPGGADPETAALNLKSDIIMPNKDFSVGVPFGVVGPTGTTYAAYDPVLAHNDSSYTSSYGKSYEVLPAPFPTPEQCSTYLSAHPAALALGDMFGVQPGYQVAIRVARSDTNGTVAYTGQVGFLNLRWGLEMVASK